MDKEAIGTMSSFVTGAKSFLNDVVFQYVPKLIVAAVVLFVGLKLIKLLNRIMNRSYDRHNVDKSLRQFLHSLIDVVLKVLLFLTVMGILGIQMTSFIAILGAAGVAVGMALQGTLQNFAGGVIILLLKPFKVGDYIEQGGLEGTVEKIQIFNTTLKTVDNRAVIIPNTDLATKSLINYSALPYRRVTVNVGVAYGEDVELARNTLLKMANSYPTVLDTPQSEVVVTGLADSSVNLSLFAYVNAPDYMSTLYALNQKTYEALGAAGITIPFNQMDVHIQKD